MISEYNHKAIAFFCATGFFPDTDTYLSGENYSYPSASLFKNKFNAFRDFQWYQKPSQLTFDAAVDEFGKLLESIIDRETGDKQVILPLSGGLDSRTLAAALKRTGKKTEAYSYSFKNGHDENKYGMEISKICNFPFHPLIVESGYLWKVIEMLAIINHCYSEFTHPRQMAFIEEYSKMGETFTLGHWGDVLFDDMRVPENLSFDSILTVIIKKITKKGGLELANMLWKSWNIEGTFNEYFHERIRQLLNRVKIDGSANATIRAFKSKFWATRWTASNFSIFESVKPIIVPYFDPEMCRFVCSLPEEFLKGRQIQIAYLKKYAPELASITWQAHKPFNLNTYSFNKTPWNMPFRVFNKMQRNFNHLKGNPLIQRNWELQFNGTANQQQLRNFLIENHSDSIIPLEIKSETFRKFYEKNSTQFAHPLSTLLTISLYSKLLRK